MEVLALFFIQVLGASSSPILLVLTEIIRASPSSSNPHNQKLRVALIFSTNSLRRLVLDGETLLDREDRTLANCRDVVLSVFSSRDRSSAVQGTPSTIYTDSSAFATNSELVTIISNPLMHLHIVPGCS